MKSIIQRTLSLSKPRAEKEKTMPLQSVHRLSRCCRRWRCRHAAQLLALAALLLSNDAAAATLTRLMCEVSQGGDTVKLAFSPVSDPYAVRAADINGRFRFKAVMVGSEQKVDYVSLYAYDLSSGRAVLIHEVKYVLPLPQRNGPPDALTGKHYVYSSKLGREMTYECALAEVEQ